MGHLLEKRAANPAAGPLAKSRMKSQKGGF
jgi:hypothetical protein